jgi:hypothetical protein
MSKAPLVFDANKSTISEAKMQMWLASDLTFDVTQVPGIGPVGAEKLLEPLRYEDGKVIENGVGTTFQLIGKYLSLRGKGVTQQMHNDAFMEWLRLKGIHTQREGITYAIAEYVSAHLPSPYDA